MALFLLTSFPCLCCSARRNAERLEREARTRVITRKGGQAAEETLAGAIANAGVTQAAAEAKTTRAPDKSNTSPARKDTTKRKSRAKSTKAT